MEDKENQYQNESNISVIVTRVHIPTIPSLKVKSGDFVRGDFDLLFYCRVEEIQE